MLESNSAIVAQVTNIGFHSDYPDFRQLMVNRHSNVVKYDI
jgi:hypothetical protein